MLNIENINKLKAYIKLVTYQFFISRLFCFIKTYTNQYTSEDICAN